MRNKKNERRLLKQYDFLGRAFGYPKCCIESFKVEAFNNHVLINREPRLLDGTGFIPCTECNESHTEESLTKLINENRMPTLVPFPDYR